MASRLHSVGEWIDAVEDLGGALNRRLLAICAGQEDLREQARGMCRKALERFAEVYGAERNVLVTRSAGRVNILGMHIDHRGGSVNPVAVHNMWLVAAPRDDDLVVARNVESGQFHEEEFRISGCLPRGAKIDDWDSWCYEEFERRQGSAAVTWSSYVRGAVLYLQHLYTTADGAFAPALRGMDMMFYGDVPRAVGLSSSSSVVVATAEAVVKLNSLEIEREQLVPHCGYAEWYVGTRGGSSDHAAILFGKANAIGHATAFPLTVQSVPFPAGYSLVLANSMNEAKKQAGARNAFNARVAAYEFGLLLLRENYPQYADKLEYLRDVNPGRLGVGETEIYRMVKSLPTSASRGEILQWLSGHESQVRRVFRSHDEPEDGYPIRQVCLYGITECIRADMVPECLRTGDMERFGELMNISHDGDRVSTMVNGQRVPTDNSYSDDRIDALIADLASVVPERVERARLWRQGGGYSVSLPDVDALVDSALAVPGVVGAGLVGAGMGGCIVAVVRSEHAQQVIDNMATAYYAPRNLPVKAKVITPVDGLHTFELQDGADPDWAQSLPNMSS